MLTEPLGECESAPGIPGDVLTETPSQIPHCLSLPLLVI